MVRSNLNSAPRQDVLASLHKAQMLESLPKTVVPTEILSQILEYLQVPDLMRFALVSKQYNEIIYDDSRWVQRLRLMGCWDEAEAQNGVEDVQRRKKVTAPKAEEMRNDTNGSQSYADQLSTTLTILSKIRPIRGAARQEYGKVYGALSPYYLDISRTDVYMESKVFRSFREPEQQAQLLSQLTQFAKSDVALGWAAREGRLRAVVQMFESAAKREFEQGFEAGDISGRMHRYAHVLARLNGGNASVKVFISQHPLFQRKEVFGDPMDCLSYAFSGSITLAPSVEFFEKLSTAVNKQQTIIKQVFPESVNVLVPFLDKVAELVVAEYVTALLDETHERGIELYLKAASGLFEQLVQFEQRVDSLLFKKVFERHIDLYLQEELFFFTKMSNNAVGEWEKRLSAQDASAESFFMSNINRQADKRDFLSSFRKVVMVPVNVVAMPFAPKTTSSTRTSTARSSPAPGEAPTTELAAKAAILNSKLENIRSLFSLEVALDLVHMAKSSLERAALFVKMGGQYGDEAKEQSEMIFVHLLQLLGSRHIKSGFDKAVDHLSKYNPREVSDHQPGVPPLIMFLELVNVGDLIQQMIDVFYEQELVATKLTDRNDFLDPAVKEKKRFEQMLDERVAAGLNKGIDVLMDEVEYLCATTQKTTDYNPSSDKSEIGTTETAQRIVEIVSAHTKMLVGSTDKSMLDVFNQEVGLRLFGALCKHLKRQRISVDGSMRLISDMSHYFGYIQTLRNNDLATYFKALRELSQIYLIGPGDAKEMAAIIADGDRFFGVFRAEEVYEFAQRRADWYQVKGKVEKAMYGAGCTVM